MGDLIAGRGCGMAGEHVDLTSEASGRPAPQPTEREQQKFLGVTFACCDVYARIYQNREQTAYVGACPRCSKPLHIGIGPGGTSSRFFTAY